MSALAFASLRFYALRHPALLQPGLDLVSYRHSSRRAVLVGPLAYLLGAALAWVCPPGALLVYALSAAYFITQEAGQAAQQA